MSFQNTIFGMPYQISGNVYPMCMLQIVPQFQQAKNPLGQAFPINIEHNFQILPNFCTFSLNSAIISSKQQEKTNNEELGTISEKKQTEEIKQTQRKKQDLHSSGKESKSSEKVQILSCQCKKSSCLKQYCFCFKNGTGCNDKCSCLGCRNTQDGLNQKRISRKHKQICCNCSRTQCSKKYCECYAAGKKCGEHCKCNQCLN